MTQTEWASGLHRRIADAIRQAREGRMSAAQVADATEQLGHPITRNVLSDYENDRKHRLDIADLLVIADALGVSPLLLLYPGAPDEPVEYLPGQTTSTQAARDRFIGDRGLAAVSAQLAQLSRAVAAHTAGHGSLTNIAEKVEEK